MHADTPPATPTPEGLAAALKMVDGLDGLNVGPAADREARRAVFAVARLVALATGAQARAGEGVGG